MPQKRRRYVPGNFALPVKRSFAGRGLFASERIPKNTCVIEYVGRTVSKKEEYTSRSRYLFSVNKHKTIDGKPKMNKAGYINHSCRPNAEPVIHKEKVFIFSTRSIPAGEEITYDYGKEYFDAYLKGKCKCARCPVRKSAKR